MYSTTTLVYTKRKKQCVKVACRERQQLCHTECSAESAVDDWVTCNWYIICIVRKSFSYYADIRYDITCITVARCGVVCAVKVYGNIQHIFLISQPIFLRLCIQSNQMQHTRGGYKNMNVQMFTLRTQIFDSLLNCSEPA